VDGRVRSATTGEVHQPGHHVRVLIVDDASQFRQAARELLERRGYVVVGEADCARTALDLAAELVPDAILLDVRLPDGTGFQLSAILTMSEPAPAVLLITSDLSLGSDELLKVSGARGLVGKAQLARTDLGRFWPRPYGARAAAG
jgi:DNA-binding NarL/FixJ family response regulator